MFFHQFISEDMGCASYLVGDTDAGECVVVDPGWDVAPYVELAAAKGMRVTLAIETHNHADHVSGHGRLAAMGVEVAVHESAGVEYAHRPLRDGETLDVGSVRLTVLHTPGHRPEHIAIAVADTTRAKAPWLVLTGDSLFVGDVARPDLAIEPGEGAAQLFRSLRDNLLSLPDGVEVYPAHVAGSLCGKAMSAKPNSTIGYERFYNPALLAESEADFVRQLTGDLPPQPPNFARIVERNRGPFVTADSQPRPMSADEVDAARREGALVLDVRSPEAFGGGHIPGALNVHLQGGQFATRASWLIEPGVSVVLVLQQVDDLAAAALGLAMTGQDGLQGYLLGGMQAWDSSGRALEVVPQMDVRELRERTEAGDRSFQVVDVREASEWREGHISGAIHVPFHDLSERLDDLPSNKPVAVVCASGTRSSIAASILKAHGFAAINIAGGVDAWRAAGGAVEG